MAFEKFPPTNTSEAVAVFKQDVIIVHDVAHGDDTAEVLTENGLIPSISKFIKDANDRIDNGLANLDHSVTTNRDAADSHTIGSITGLQTELDDKATNADLALKANISDLAASTGASGIGADGSGGLTPASVQAQLNELKALIDAKKEGGMFRLIHLESSRIAAGASGNILVKNITDVSGATAIKIKYLLTGSTTAEPDMQLTTVDGLTLIDTLTDNTPSASVTSNTTFGVTDVFDGVAISSGARLLREIYCEGFTLTKTTGVTATPIDYVIEYGIVE